MRVGIDLGSTYSGFSRYDYANNRVEPIILEEGEPFSIPSVVYIDPKGKILTGYAAKGKIKRTGRRFEHFKMLLNEKDSSIISSRGYDDEFTPRVVTKMFLEAKLNAALKVCNDDRFEKVCICVPELWGRGVSTLDGRSILRDILLNEIDIPMDHVQVVLEPEAASAYYAFNYERETQKQFNGYLLLIDYGGGTLDITLTEVNSSGHGNMEICNREGCGAGENHIDPSGNRIVGNAGVSYMQEVVVTAIKDNDSFSDIVIDFSDPDFVKAMSEFESTIKAHERMDDIEDYFSQFGSYSDFDEALEQEEEEFTSFDFRDEEIVVSYQCLYKAYKSCIESILNDQIRKINTKVKEYIHDDPCKPSSGNKDNFKIALVGGFVGCYFVKAQLYEIYNMDANYKNDPRIKSISTDKKEQAISLGAALIAADKVKLQKTSGYSIGLYAADASGKYKPYYGIKFHQVVVANKPYFILRDESQPDQPGNRITYGNLAGIKQFIIEFSENLDVGMLMTLKPVMLEKLKELPAQNFWNCGFSMDDSGVVSFHILPRGTDDLSSGKTIVLDSYNNMFDLSAG